MPRDRYRPGHMPGRHLKTPLSELASAVGSQDPARFSAAKGALGQLGYKLMRVSDLKDRARLDEALEELGGQPC